MKFLKYVLPPILWMAVIFPVGNKALGSSLIYEVFMSVLKTVLPHVSAAAAGTAYIIFRKSLHFFAYGLLAFLVHRAFRGGAPERWKPRWLAWTAGISAGYGLLDEALQATLPRRTGSPIDWAVDTAGILTALALITRWAKRGEGKGASSAPPPRPAFGRALFLKRPFDVVLSALGLLLSAPLGAAIAAAVWLEDRGPVFYFQERVGRHGRVFKAWKFRSMARDAEKDGEAVQAVENDPRVTRVGRLLRATAMDELPQLVNIFRGDMSFVGPRALRPREKEVNGDPDVRPIEEIPGYRERHSVRPGLTGLTQVFFPGDTPRRKKFRCDLLYIRKRSFCFDLRLIVLSFWITFRGKWESRAGKV
jgi:lipopolysaccharide/colanic/teichoic acid biosynthesis glycosyltransferase/VanZ family protein